MKMKKPYLSVVIPAYNEEYNVKSGVLAAVYDYLRQQKYSWEVVVVDDESTDGTVREVKKFIKKQILLLLSASR